MKKLALGDEENNDSQETKRQNKVKARLTFLELNVIMCWNKDLTLVKIDTHIHWH